MKKMIERAKVLIEAIPFFQEFEGKTFVIKYGGNAMVNEELQKKVMQDVILLKQVGIRVVLVHGGGPHLTEWLGKVNKKSEFIEGLRVTDEETVELAEMVFVGKVNKQIISLINGLGGKAVGLGGRDGKLIIAEKKKTKVDIGFVGDVKEINSEIIETLLDSGFTPVISSVGACEDGQAYNINADTVAEAIATKLKAEKLFLLTDVDGVLREGELIPRFDVKEGEQLIDNGIITGGMIPKIRGAMEAVKNGVGRVHIINGQVEHSTLLEVFTQNGIGTMIRK